MRRVWYCLAVVVASSMISGCEFPAEEPDVQGRLKENGFPMDVDTLFEPTLVDDNGAIGFGESKNGG